MSLNEFCAELAHTSITRVHGVDAALRSHRRSGFFFLLTNERWASRLTTEHKKTHETGIIISDFHIHIYTYILDCLLFAASESSNKPYCAQKRCFCFYNWSMRVHLWRPCRSLHSSFPQSLRIQFAYVYARPRQCARALRGCFFLSATTTSWYGYAVQFQLEIRTLNFWPILIEIFVRRRHQLQLCIYSYNCMCIWLFHSIAKGRGKYRSKYVRLVVFALSHYFCNVISRLSRLLYYRIISVK